MMRMLFRRRMVLMPTLLGWFLLLTIAVLPLLLWVAHGESFLRQSSSVPPGVLVVEGWIGIEAIRAAAEEFRSRPYTRVIATGGPARSAWSYQDGNYAQMAAEELRKAGVPQERLLVAPVAVPERDRTLASAVAVRAALLRSGPLPDSLTVFTSGTHARRSRLVFQRTFGGTVKVGSTAWSSPGAGAGAWWQSSERAKDLVVESLAYAREATVGAWRSVPAHPTLELPGTVHLTTHREGGGL